jgi:uncharacterized protein YbjQ (UPF0145 family)
VGGGILGSLKTLARGEIREFSDVFNHTRHAALDRAVGEARRGRANSVVGTRTTISTGPVCMRWSAQLPSTPPCLPRRSSPTT